MDFDSLPNRHFSDSVDAVSDNLLARPIVARRHYVIRCCSREVPAFSDGTEESRIDGGVEAWGE